MINKEENSLQIAWDYSLFVHSFSQLEFRETKLSHQFALVSAADFISELKTSLFMHHFHFELSLEFLEFDENCVCTYSSSSVPFWTFMTNRINLELWQRNHLLDHLHLLLSRSFQVSLYRSTTNSHLKN